MGKRQRTFIFDFYNYCDCFILPSLKETFGVSIIEAMACGLPILSSHSGGAEDIIIIKIRFVFDFKLCDLVEKMEFVFNNIDQFDPFYIREFVLEKYQLAKLPQYYLIYIQRITNVETINSKKSY